MNIVLTRDSSGWHWRRGRPFTTIPKPTQRIVQSLQPVQKTPVQSHLVKYSRPFPQSCLFQLNDKLAPGAYSYLIVIDGVGLICTCLWRKQKNSNRYLNETIACYEKLYPELDREPIKRVGGKGDFSIPSTYFANEQYFVGEAGGLQDFMWGFGMRYAVTSGVMAANCLLNGTNYDAQIRKELLP